MAKVKDTETMTTHTSTEKLLLKKTQTQTVEKHHLKN